MKDKHKYTDDLKATKKRQRIKALATFAIILLSIGICGGLGIAGLLQGDGEPERTFVTATPTAIPASTPVPQAVRVDAGAGRPLLFNSNAGYEQQVEIRGIYPLSLGFEYNTGFTGVSYRPCQRTHRCIWLAPAVPHNQTFFIVYYVASGELKRIAVDPSLDHIIINDQ